MTYADKLSGPARPDARPASERPRPHKTGLSLRGQGIATALILSAALAIFSPAPGVVMAAGGSLAALFYLLWRRGEPPILLFPLLYQWSVVAVKPYMSAIQHVPLIELTQYGANLEKAAYFGFAAVTFVALGIRLSVGRLKRNWAAELEAEVRAMPLKRVLMVTGALIVFGLLMNVLAPIVPGMRQVFLVLAGFGAAGVFFLAYWCLKNRRGYAWLVGLMVLEIGVGFTGFFSGFQAPILVFFLAAMCARDRLTIGNLVVLVAAGVLMIGLASFWSDIKQEYRRFMNQGTGDQIILVSLGDRIGYVLDEAATFDKERLGNGFELFLKRHSYIDFLAATMDYVPYFTPHENGKRLGRTVIHVLTPRVLFPNKPPTDFDTEVTMQYTGITLTLHQGTSISIGYLGELYIDFGLYGALVACFIGGLGIGSGWRLLRDSGRGSLLLRFGLYALLALSLSQFGFALIKFVGGAGTAFLGAYLIQRFVLPYVGTMLRPRRRPGRAGPALPRPG